MQELAFATFLSLNRSEHYLTNMQEFVFATFLSTVLTKAVASLFIQCLAFRHNQIYQPNLAEDA